MHFKSFIMPTETTEISYIFFALAFVGIFVAIAIVALFVVFSMNKNKMIQSQLKADLEYQKKLNSVQLTALRGQMNPHFVHNSLNAIQYYIQRNEVDISEDYLVKFSKLIRLFFEYSRRQNISIKDEVDLLTHYLQIEKLRFEDKLSYTIEVDENIDQEEQIIPSMLLQPIVENGVNHGLFHKQGPGKIEIKFIHMDEFSFQVLIKDDGIGINKAKEIQRTSSKNYQSRSSQVLQERLELFKQSNEWDIDFKIEDLSDTHNDQTGTLVNLIFKQPEEI